MRKWEVSRRAVLRGAGIAVGLPYLEAMVPWEKRARAAGVTSPRRLVFFVFTGGTPETTDNTEGPASAAGAGIPGCLRPKSTGPGFEITPLLAPLGDLKDDILVVSRLHNAIGELGTGKYAGGDHPRAANALLTGVSPEYADGPNTAAAISVDQLAASRLRQFTPALPSLYLSNPVHPDFAGQFMCWSNPTTRLYPIVKPSEQFARLIGDSGVDPKIIQKRLAYRRGVLDHAKEDTDRLMKKLGKADRDALDKYLTSVHDLEAQIASSGASAATCSTGDVRPDDAAAIPDHFDQVLQMLALAFQCDRTRVAVVHLMTHDRWFNWLGAPNNAYPNWHDDVEHAGSAPRAGFTDLDDRLQAYLKGSAWEIGQFGNLVRQLKSMREGESGIAVLDNSALVCTSEISYGDGHSMRCLPVIVAGKSGGAITPGRHIVVDRQPIANLWLSMLHAAGIDTPSFGNSTQALPLT